MPASITHYHHALKAWNRCGLKDRPNLKDAFLWGAQGPDFFYYHHLLCPGVENLRGIGSRLHHEQPSRLLSVMRDIQNSREDEIEASYLKGFLCHYSLDRTVHPFVFHDVSLLRGLYPGRGDSFLHNQVESVLDGILLRSVTGGLANEFDLRRTVPRNSAIQAAIARFYSDVLERLYGMHGLRKALVQSTADCRKISGFLNDRWMIKKPLAETAEKITHRYLYSSVIRGISEPDEFDYANVLHSEWKWPENAANLRKESFFDLFEASVRESVHFITSFETADLCDLTNNIPFC